MKFTLYGLFDTSGKKCFYVGSSKDLGTRILSHFAAKDCTGGKDFLVKVFGRTNAFDRALDESRLIWEFKKINQCKFNENGVVLAKAEQTWDWSERDVDLGRKYGYTRERVRQIRNICGIGRAANHRVQMGSLSFWIRNNIQKLSVMTPKNRLPYAIRNRPSEKPHAIRSALIDNGIRLPRPENQRKSHKWKFVNWDLPDRDLARAWRITRTGASTPRLRYGHASKWDARRNNDCPKYKSALRLEQSKAKTYWKTHTI